LEATETLAMSLSEHKEQVLLIRWWKLQYPKLAKCLFAIPNGGHRHIITAIKLKDEGVVSGVSDLFLMMPKGDLHGLFIEMKAKKGRVSPEQTEFMKLATDMGYLAVVCYGFDEAKKVIETYLLL
jgi:hypothetical protein